MATGAVSIEVATTVAIFLSTSVSPTPVATTAPVKIWSEDILALVIKVGRATTASETSMSVPITLVIPTQLARTPMGASSVVAMRDTWGMD
jgi:hypothetical protein